MKLRTFTADSAGEALEEIRRELGPQAVVVHVRRVGGQGLARLWQKSKIEVVAFLPELAADQSGDSEALRSLGELRREVAELRDRIPPPAKVPPEIHPTPPVVSLAPLSDSFKVRRNGAGPRPEPVVEVLPLPENPAPPDGDSGWILEKVLQDSGVHPVHARRMMQVVQSAVSTPKPQEWQEELSLAMPVLKRFWSERNAPGSDPSIPSRHVFIGSPGSGKTNVICKWMTQEVLLSGRKARVWRLDGNRANSAEILSVYAEVLGVPVERIWDPASQDPGKAGFDLEFIDLPGVPVSDKVAMTELASQLRSLEPVQVHGVFNASYELPILLGQLRAFSKMGVRDLILTHLDEELNRGKIWNLLLGTNCRIRFLSAGQNIPGDFFAADADRIFSRQLSCNQ